MSRPPRLTEHQRSDLADLEPRLQQAAIRGDYSTAQQVTAQIQRLLRPTGHETRLMKCKNWLFEAAMEAGDFATAEAGFVGVRSKVAPTTRVYLEATALLAICLLRQRKVTEAKGYIAETLRCLRNVQSRGEQQRFRREMVARFEQESLIGALGSTGSDQFAEDTLQQNAGQLCQTVDERELLRRLGQALSPATIAILEDVRAHSRNVLTADEKKALPSPESLANDVSRGETLFAALKRSAWRALCDSDSDVYKLWWTKGISAVMDKKALTAALVAALGGLRIGQYAVIACVLALIFKVGLEAFCEVSKPKLLMETRSRR